MTKTALQSLFISQHLNILLFSAFMPSQGWKPLELLEQARTNKLCKKAMVSHKCVKCDNVTNNNRHEELI